MSDVVLPPATGTWWQLAPTLAAVLHTLRLAGADIDVAPIEDAIETAAALIDQYVDSPTVVTTAPAPLQQALEQLAVELYQPAIARPVGAEGTTLVVADENALATVEPLLRPYRRRWGVA
jgi:electron transfer flavoprotein alpha/beta subunit